MNHKVTIGLLIWIGLISGCLFALQQLPAESTRGLKQLFQHAFHFRYSAKIRLPDHFPLAVGDLVFLDDEITPIGYLSQVGQKPPRIGVVQWADSAEVTFYANAPVIRKQDSLIYHHPPDDLGWVVQTMLPPKKRIQITELILQTYLKDQHAITQALRPIVTESLVDAAEIIRQDLKLALDQRQDRLNSIGKRYQKEFVESQIVPLIKEEIWPIVQEEAETLANQIGHEIWKEISVFRLTWKYLYDRSGIPEKSLTKQELERFLETKAVPIIESHLPDILEVQGRIMARVSRNPRTQQTISDAVTAIGNDDEIKEILGEIFQEVMLKNQALKDSLTANWSRPQAKQAIADIADRIEPTVSEIGVVLFGPPDGEITPEFARVLRHRILKKDQRWFTLQLGNVRSETQQAPPPSDRPREIFVKIADPSGNIPYAPARKR